MAEKQLAYRASEKEEFFADDDPLAELARIVGFEPRPAAPTAPVTQRHEPAFDLEDELLREFERYDAPRLSPVDDIPLSVEDEPFHGEAAYSQPGNSNDPHLDHRRAEPEFADLQPEPEALAEAYASGDAAWSQEEIPVEGAELHAAEFELPRYELVAEVPVARQAYEPASSEESSDLADELELSIAETPAKPVAPVTRVPQWAAASIRLPLANFNAPRRQDVAPEDVNPPVEVPAAPVAEVAKAPIIEPDAPPASGLGFPAEQDRHEFPSDGLSADAEPAFETFPELEPVASGFDLAAAARDGDVPSDAALTEPAYAEGSPSLDIDDLLDDVSRYPVPQRAASVENERQPNPAAAIAQSPVMAPAPVAAARPEQREEPKPAEMDIEDPFADHDFEFDLEGIELELADFDFTESNAPELAPQQPASQPAPVVTPVAAAPRPIVAERTVPDEVRRPASEGAHAAAVLPTAIPRAVPAPRPELATRSAFAPILHTPAPVAASAPVASVAMEQPSVDAEQVLPFDPSEISDTDDRIETFEGMHVPTLPPVEKEEPVSMPPEYDFDIDAEMANLFNTPAKESAPEPGNSPVEAAAASWARVTSTRTAEARKPVDELDEFERALKEDFRRSVREASHPAENVARMTLESSNVTADRRRARSMRGVAIAAVAVVIAGAGAYGAYNWVSHGSSIIAAGEPRVITADKDPVKVLPENPGGKVVPNQDKAVYDSVTGDAAPAPKQKELVSSNEQPVDVVQKTLIPEAVSPDDSDGGDAPVTSTPVGETEDPRLLPDQSGNTASAAADSQDNVPSVSPRKVRTMIVKPDGTLVARDDSAPATGNTAKAPATPAKLAPATSATPIKPPATSQMASAEARAPAVPGASDDDAPSAESAPIRVVKTAPLPAVATANASASPASPTVASFPTPPVAAKAVPTPAPVAAPAPAPVAAAASAPVVSAPAEDTDSAASDIAPVPTARPAQPAKVAAHPAPAEAQVASVSPAAQPVKAAPAASAGAGGYVMQIASLPSEADARKSQANLSSKFASVIGGHPVEVKRFDIAGKGTYYRVRVVAGTKDQAADLCVRYRQAGGTCLISK
jgi:hypothetical protein